MSKKENTIQHFNGFREEIDQDIKARLTFNSFHDNSMVLDGSYSVYKFNGKSCVHEPYAFTIYFISDEEIHIEDIVDTDVQLHLTDTKDRTQTKQFCGKIFEASQDSVVGKKFSYKIELVCPVHYLSLNKRYEIFHDKKVSDIIVEILNRYATLLNIKIDVKLDLQKAPIREYTTLYDQSDLEFIQMLCEEEGYSLVFDYSQNDPYVITLCELNEHCKVVENTATGNFNFSKKFMASHRVEDYFDEDKPSLDMKYHAGQNITSSIKDNESTSQLRAHMKRYHLRDKLNLIDESLFKDLNRYSKVEAQRQYVQSSQFKGNSLELYLHEAMSIALHDEKARKASEVIILNVEYKGYFPNALDEYVEQDEVNKEDFQYQVSFTAIPKDIEYRPPLQKRKKYIPGIQTAIVSSGVSNTSDHANEIVVDEKGRIKVLFHFEQNQTTSCFVRLSNAYSGNGYGSQFLPRVNSEVIVSFINGDIDKPIIIGSVHNGENKHPYNLPKEKTKSFIKTHSIPAHKDEFGYNELAFEDKRGEELLSLRAQKDFKLHAQNNQYVQIDNNARTIIGNDETRTIKNNVSQTVGKDSTRCIVQNDIKVVEKEEIHTIQEDKELHVLKDFNTIVKDNHKTIVEHDMITRVKGILHQYIEKDVKQKYLSNAFMQIGKDYRLDVQNAYHLKSKHIKHTTNTFEVEAQEAISLRVGGSVLTVDTSGIHLKSPVVDTASGNGGVTANVVDKPEILKPLYNKVRVTNLSVDITQQSEITDVLTFTAEVEVYENDAWVAKTELTQTQQSQLQWVFIKNNDSDDKDILLDNPTNDNITIEGLTMTVRVEKENIYKYGHGHCYVVEPEDEGYAVSELKRYLEVTNIKSIHTSQEEGKCKAILNIDEPTEDELAQIRWTVEGKDVGKYNGKKEIMHNLKEENVYEINFTAFIDGKAEKGANAMLVYDEKVKILTSLGFKDAD